MHVYIFLIKVVSFLFQNRSSIFSATTSCRNTWTHLATMPTSTEAALVYFNNIKLYLGTGSKSQ